jgi:N-carbamoyl-L-amino-acid hydrolase
MIFVPSIDGISHNPAENTRPEHLELGANVLLHTLLDLAQ